MGDQEPDDIEDALRAENTRYREALEEVARLVSDTLAPLEGVVNLHEK